MLDEIEMLCQSNKLRKHSLRSQDSEGAQGDNQMQQNEEQFDDESLCSICYSA